MNKTFFLDFSDPTNAVLSTSQVVGTLDNNVFPAASISPVTSPVTASPSGPTPYNFTVSLSQPSPQTVTLNYSTTPGTGAAGVDYQSVTNQTVTFLPGVTSQTISINVLNNTAATSNPTFNVILSNPTNATIATASATGTIQDVQVVTSSNVEQTAPPVGAANMTFTVSLSNAVNSDVTVDYSTADGTAMAGIDYTAESSSVTIPAGSTSATFTVPITAQTIYEGTKSFTVNLSIPAPPTGVVLQTTSVTGTIDPAVAMPELLLSALDVGKRTDLRQPRPLSVYDLVAERRFRFDGQRPAGHLQLHHHRRHRHGRKSIHYDQRPIYHRRRTILRDDQRAHLGRIVE